MTDQPPAPKLDRPALPRDSFRLQRSAAGSFAAVGSKPVVVTPDYGDAPVAMPMPIKASDTAANTSAEPTTMPRTTIDGAKLAKSRNPMEAYGERSSSRPYALRLPEPIDLALRQIAAEERTHPLRVIDRLILKHLASIGRLPQLGKD